MYTYQHACSPFTQTQTSTKSDSEHNLCSEVPVQLTSYQFPDHKAAKSHV